MAVTPSSTPTIQQQVGPALTLRACVSDWGQPLANVSTPDWLQKQLREPVVLGDDIVRKAMRDLLRRGGYKPSGRNKPSAEYLAKAAAASKLESINAAVDACNAASLQSGISMSVIDLERLEQPLGVRVVEQGDYVFNPSGQRLQLAGLICLHDAVGPCANAVKDSQRSKTSGSTQRTLSVVWGPSAVQPLVEACFDAYLTILKKLQATSVSCPVIASS